VSRRKLVVIGLLVLVVVVFILQGGRHAGGGNSANTQCQVQIGVAGLNVRSAPDPTATVIEQLADGTITAATSTVQNGYRQLAANRWADNQWIRPVAGAC
jgi:predicted carbohydrate-binding protein with CBM5 and CBM33 domain